MPTTRLEAFSDGVIAILITIMVLELKMSPDHADVHELRQIAPRFLAYVLSFANLGIYWNNHHHMLQATHRVNGRILWSNLHLLFWLSLFPSATAWMGEHHSDAVPVALYGVISLAAAIAYYVLQTAIIAEQGPDGPLAQAIGRDVKGKVSPVIYLTAIPMAWVSTWLSIACFVAVAMVWFVPDKRVERTLIG